MNLRVKILLAASCIAGLLAVSACGGGGSTKTGNITPFSPGTGPLTIATPTLANGSVGATYNATVLAGGAAQWGVSWTLSGTLPPGLTGVAQAGSTPPAYFIGGTPTIEGDYVVALTVTNGPGETATRNFSVRIAPFNAVVIGSTSLPDGIVATPYTASVGVSGGTGTGYTWTHDFGQLPPGITGAASASGTTYEFTGTPTADGDFPLQLTVKDSNQREASQQLVITIAPQGGVGGTGTTPALKIIGLPSPAGTILLPDAFVGQAYTYALEATGGTGQDYTWALEPFQVLPTGLTGIPGTATPKVTISGTPTQPGQFDFSVTVTDSGANTARADIRLHVFEQTGSWTSLPPAGSPNQPEGRIDHTAFWTGTHMLVWGGRRTNDEVLTTGGLYDPVTNTWVSKPNLNSGTGSPGGRIAHAAVWTGATGNAATANRLIVWGGASDAQTRLSDGGMYNPATDTWEARTNLGAGKSPLLEREGATAVFTGDTGNAATSYRMIVWGGTRGGTEVWNDGAMYDPATDLWEVIAAPNIEGRTQHSAVWTGQTGNPNTANRMIVWGGCKPRLLQSSVNFSDGASFNAATGGWMELGPATLPMPRNSHTAEWTTNGMLVFGGKGGSALGVAGDTGGVLTNPAMNTWTPTEACGQLHDYAHVWTGSKLVLFGGTISRRCPNVNWSVLVHSRTNHSTIWDPVTDDWHSSMTLVGAPEGRHAATGVWTGSAMIVWGGLGASGDALNSGGAWTP